jgi:hypothetical protein
MMSQYMFALLRKLGSCPALVGYVMNCGSALMAACPSRVPLDSVQRLWDLAINQGKPEGR